VLDPRSGFGVGVDRIVTVMASTASRADALASALAVLGEDGAALVRGLGALQTIVIDSQSPSLGKAKPHGS
jgi:thiamine biosynthesis lipoprotein ApbE